MVGASGPSEASAGLSAATAAPLPTFTPVTHGLRLTSESDTHIYAQIRKYLCSNSETRVRCGVCVCARACCRQTKPAVCCSRALEADLPQCLHCLQRREGCGEGDVAPCRGEMWPSAADQHTLRSGSCCWSIMLRWCRRRPLLEPANSRLCSPVSGEVKLQLLTSGRKRTPKRPLQFVKQCSNLSFDCNPWRSSWVG